jgi:hypothetical protein
MKSLLTLLLLLVCFTLPAQQVTILHASPVQDSVTISGRVIDESGKPVKDAWVVFYPFHLEKHDVTWYEKDTTLTDAEGCFEVKCTRGQFISNRLYINQQGYFTAEHYFGEINACMRIDTAIVLHDRKSRWFDAGKIGPEILGMTMEQALKLIQPDVWNARQWSFSNPNGSYTKALRAEVADSTIILLIPDSNSGNAGDMLSQRIDGVGLAFPGGEKRFIGNAALYSMKVYNEYADRHIGINH